MKRPAGGISGLALAVGAAAALAAALSAAPAGAAPIRWGQARFDRLVQDQPLGGFLRELLAQTTIRLELSPKITGNVSGAFNGDSKDTFRKVADAFNLLTYFDGHTLFVYPAADIATRSFGQDRADAERIQAVATRERLADTQNHFEIEGDRLVATGAKPFLDQLEAISRVRPILAPKQDPPLQVLGEPPVAPSDPLEFRVYYLRYAWAEDATFNAGGQNVTVPGVASVVRGLVLGDRGEAPSPPKAPTQAGALTGLAGTGLGADGRGNPAGAASIAGLLTLANSATTHAAAEQPAPSPAAEEARVEVDRGLNAIIIRDVRSHLDAYGALIRALDIEPQIVQIEATIIDVDLEHLKQSGLTFGFEDARGDAFISSPGVAPVAGGGLFLSTVIDSNTRFIASLNALEARGVTRVVSRPLVLTLSDVEAIFQDNQTFYVPVNGSLSSDLFDVSAGTTLRVTPHVVRDKGQNRIRLLVGIEDGSLSSQTVRSIPVVRRSNLTTEALLVDGQSLLVGGMVSQQSGGQRSRIPGIGDIPIAGALFRTAQSSDDHIERLFLITPHLTAVGASAPEPGGLVGSTGQAPAPEPPRASPPVRP